MRSSRSLVPLLLLVPAAVGCSDSGSNKPDAFVVVADARPDAPPLPPGCDAQELNDLSNDTFETASIAEDTMISFTGNSTICGKANASHFEAPTMAGEIGVVDVDAYKFTMAADGVVYVTFGGTGLEGLTGNFRIYDRAQPEADQLVLFSEMHGGHTAARVGLAMGTYEIQTIVLGDAAPSADVSYKIKLATDVIDTRCVPLTTGGFVEASDGAGFGNDMIKWKYGATGAIALTATTADMPEATAIVAAPTMKYRVSGTSANITSAEAATDDYKDHDTFEFTTDATTNELTVNFKFPVATTDMDIAIFDKPAPGDTELNFLDISNRLAAGPSGEILTTAVEPSKTYWLWVGGYKTYPSGANDLPSTAGTYDATICASKYAP